MKLIDVIKTKNGLAYLDKNKNQISTDMYRLGYETGYKPNVDYGESKFSYKEHVRKFGKVIGSNLQDVLTRLYHKKVHMKLVTLLVGTPTGTIYIDFDGDCIDVELDGSISFTPYNKLPVFLAGSYVEKGRQKMSMFKFFMKIAPATVSEQEVKEFVDLIYADVALDLTLEFVKGVDIGKYYNQIDTNNWSKTSCMTKREIRKFKLYTDNPDTVELGIIKNGEEIVGRFLRWKTEELGWVEDTLYYKTYPVYSWFNARAEAENSWRKVSRVHFVNNKKEHKTRLTVKLVYSRRDYDDNTKPYLDTFSGIGEDYMSIHNQAPIN